MSTNPTDLNIFRSEVSARLDPLGSTVPGEAFEDRCRSYLQSLRWPGGVECPRCEETSRLLWLESRSKWHCYECRYQFSVTAGTLFHSSHLPVWKWFVAVHLMLESPEGISANELRRVIGGSYKTAWYVAHRIRAAMRGRGADLLRSLVDAESEHLAGSSPAVDPLWADVAASLAEAGSLDHGLSHDRGMSRTSLDHGESTVLMRMRRLVAGPHHGLSTKYLHAYIDERRWRSAHRDNPHVFRDTIVALLQGEGISYEQLVATG
jgi:transposase-like protein